MTALILGLLCAALFFVPGLPLLLALLTFLAAMGPLRKRRRRLAAGIGLMLALGGNAVALWLWRFGHLP